MIALLEFIYSNKVELNETLALDLLNAADKYLMKDLKYLCEEFLSQNLSLRNIVNLAQIAEAEDLSMLRKAITKFVPKYLQRILENKHLYKLPDSFYWEIMSNLTQTK